MRESDLIHNSLILTSIMKKSYYKKSEDCFNIEVLDFYDLKIQGTSLSTMNLINFKRILNYVVTIQKEMEKQLNRRVTYKEIRFELQKRKSKHFILLKQCLVES